jgi:hypothetical protein
MRLENLQEQLEEHGLLLLTDAKLPSVVSLAVGAPIKGSWWAHPRGKEIYALLVKFTAHEDVLCVKLVDGKVTFLHRRLWPAFLAIARAKEPWQTEKLSKSARELFARVEECGEHEAKGATAKELEIRLLVHSGQVHTESGAHALVLTSWKRWSKQHGPIGRAIPVARAKQEFHARLAEWNRVHRAKARLPF